VIPGDRPDHLGRRSRYFDGALEVAAELVPAVRGADAEGDAEVVSLRIAADERFGEDDQFGPLLGGIGGEVGELLRVDSLPKCSSRMNAPPGRRFTNSSP